MRSRKYHVTLTEEKYKQLLELVSKGKAAAQKVRNAEILLALDETFNEKPSTIEGIKKAYHINGHTVCNVA